jgi:transposase, IS5 family
VAGLFILKHMHNLSDEALYGRLVENPYFQYFCGEVVFSACDAVRRWCAGASG